MRRNRLILSLLATAFLLYIAIPRLDVQSGGLEGAFALIWLLFALIAFGGNLVGLLFTTKRSQNSSKMKSASRQKVRQYQ
ncbi:hypothetical protein LCL95_14985 [Bacillus timonensis]|nr:hypothetical protein [Bacillus timonensis]